MKKQIIGVSWALVLAGCQSTPDYQFVATEQQKLSSSVSQQKLSSAGKVQVAIAVDQQFEGKYDFPALAVELVNNTDTPINFSIGNIRILADGRPLRLVTPANFSKVRADRAQRLLKMASDCRKFPKNAGKYCIKPTDPALAYQYFVEHQLDSHRLHPSNSYTGYVSFVEPLDREIHEYQISMSVGGEEHRFKLRANAS